jgi:Nuclease-related domain
MWVLRKGGDFADRRIESYANHILGAFTVSAVVLIAFGYLGSPLIGVFAAIAVIVATQRFFDLFRRWSRGKQGEVRIVDVLHALPNDYVVLNDLVMPGRGGNIDHCLIGPNGLFVIETKNYSGYMRCDGDRWFVYRREINSLSIQAKRNSMAIRANLEALFAQRGMRVPYVKALLVFVNPETRLKLFKPTVPVLRLEELVEFIRNYKAYSSVSPDLRHAIVRHLQTLQNNAGHGSSLPPRFKSPSPFHKLLKSS